ncbi:vesicular-fusion protein S17 [Coemansia sp. RSA 1722]|nr:vesicular-fusion protein S17 [Coemansia sp. RSA 485]KAJ2233485.1 vesicular-fusion protein S17 [Coemansia sp. RSA 485]KAJ2599015.1 vesicular-fusion protein S17 [Coemansia sp. RSA 1721]KAJ2602133.1 vesicular-fusion protein S17 [Coemansia sp. RSA 1722]KAJ2637077.1 vesicular-fusion protein S17 [Coemansia sp. RSA 1286]
MSDKRAHELLQEAEKKATQKGWFSGPKYEEAGELYEQAANQFKIAKLMREAGDAMMSAAQMSLKVNERDDAAQRFVTASKSYKKNSPEQAVDALTQAVALLTERGRFRMAASHKMEIARIYEEDLSDVERAMAAYDKAAEWYSDEDSPSLANKCLLKVAGFAAQLQNYERAIAIFESIAEASLDNQLTKWSVKDYFLKAALCRLAIPDDIGAAEALERYRELDPGFDKSREYKFLDDIIADVKKGDIQSYTDHVAGYDQISQLDKWKTTLLLSIKHSIAQAEDDLM